MRTAIAALLLVLAGFLAGVMSAGVAAPHCPSEDSCYPDYSGGRWSIIEGERP